mmetsp:Transcript_57151/g.107423  ORF Transcript_57151/g.107423 Transcript_57151/m.107423 type:complete len:281 (+) Transcript_57151:4397-5239(+)
MASHHCEKRLDCQIFPLAAGPLLELLWHPDHARARCCDQRRAKAEQLLNPLCPVHFGYSYVVSSSSPTASGAPPAVPPQSALPLSFADPPVCRVFPLLLCRAPAYVAGKQRQSKHASFSKLRCQGKARLDGSPGLLHGHLKQELAPRGPPLAPCAAGLPQLPWALDLFAPYEPRAGRSALQPLGHLCRPAISGASELHALPRHHVQFGYCCLHGAHQPRRHQRPDPHCHLGVSGHGCWPELLPTLQPMQLQQKLRLLPSEKTLRAVALKLLPTSCCLGRP